MIKKLISLFFKLFRLQFIKYGFIGGLSALIDLSLLFLLDRVLKLNFNFSVSMAYLISAVFNFTMHYRYTFEIKSKKIILPALIKYVITISVASLINLGLMNLFVQILQIDLFLAKGMTFIFIYIYGFFANKYFVYC